MPSVDKKRGKILVHFDGGKEMNPCPEGALTKKRFILGGRPGRGPTQRRNRPRDTHADATKVEEWRKKKSKTRKNGGNLE